MSLDWIVQRASENVDDFLGESHVTLIDEPLGRFVQAQALHDLRNLFSRLSGSTGIARAYRIRLTDDRPRCDIAFQLSDGRVLLEAVPSPDNGFGEALGSVGGLVDGLAELQRRSLARGRRAAAARADRLRSLRSSASATIATSAAPQALAAMLSAPASEIADLPPIVADAKAAPVPLFPRKPQRPVSRPRPCCASPSRRVRETTSASSGIRAADARPAVGGGRTGRHASVRKPHAARTPNFELHAAAELFAQMFADAARDRSPARAPLAISRP